MMVKEMGCLSDEILDELAERRDKEVEKTFVDYTTCFSNVKFLPKGVVAISISPDTPVDWKGRVYKKLMPVDWHPGKWRTSADEEREIARFEEEVLKELDPHKVWNELKEIAFDGSFALVCNATPGEFCHRHLVADWLNSHGYKVEEFIP